MKITCFFTSLAILIMLNSIPLLNAQTLQIKEDFEMVSGSTVSGQNGWTAGATSTNRVVVDSEGLTYPGYFKWMAERL
jgi:hypothetical protein